MKRHLFAALAIAFFALVLAVVAIQFLGRNEGVVVDAAPACAPRANPCATMRCEVKIDNRRFT